MASGNGTAAPSALRDKIAKNNPARVELYQSKAWDVTLELRGLTLGARSRINRDGYTIEGPHVRIVHEKFYPALLAEAVYEPGTDTRVFPNDDSGEFVNKLDPREVDEIARIILRLSAMTEEEDKELKNDSGTLTSSSSSSSRTSSRKRSRS